MTKFLLVGVSHDLQARRLMNSQCEASFCEKVLPHLTNNSVIFAEGLYNPSLVRPGSKSYSLGDFGNVLGEVRPTFGFCDPRWDKNPNKVARRTQMITDWIKLANKIFQFSSVPTTGPNVLKAIMADDFECDVLYKLSSEGVELARYVQGSIRKFDRSYSEAMQKCKTDTCIFVGGLAHCLSLAKRTGYEYVNLDEGIVERQPQELYLGYAATHVCPDKVLSMI
jgi:hypothetical protein